MLKALMTFISPYKLYVYAGVLALLVGGWWVDRHSYGAKQYAKAVEECALNQAKAEASYWEDRAARITIEAKAAAIKETETSTSIETRASKRKASVEKSIELDKANPNGACVYTADELSDINQAIREANQ